MTVSNKLSLVLLGLPLAASTGTSKSAAVARIDPLHPGLIQVTSDQSTGWSDSASAWTPEPTPEVSGQFFWQEVIYSVGEGGEDRPMIVRANRIQ